MILFALMSQIAALTLVAGLAAQDLVDDEGKRFDDLTLFAAIFHRALDDDCDGFLVLQDLAKVVGASLESDDPETRTRMADYDDNEDGKVSPEELAEGIRRGARKQVDISLLVDANADDALTPKEHALGFPDPKGTKDEHGFTARQIQGFRFLDQNGNQVVTRDELTRRHEGTFLVISWSQTMAHHMKRIDFDGDGLVRADEFVRGLGGASLDELAPEQQHWFGTLSKEHDGSPAIALDILRVQLLQDRPVSSRMAMERPIRPLLVPICARN